MQTYERDLAVTGQPMEEWLAKLLVWFLIGLLGPIALVLLGNAAGLGIPMLAAPALGLVGAAAPEFVVVMPLRVVRG